MLETIHRNKKFIALFLAVGFMAPMPGPVADACSRATWIGRDGSVITGRTMDWPYDFNTHFYVIPRGEKNEGLPGGHSWTSKFGVVVAAGAANPGGPINGVFDGMNEKGLGGNMLYLAETDFGPEPTSGKPKISWTAWLQYVLSNFSTVSEAVEAMKAEPVYLVPVGFGPGGAGHPTVHLSLSDPSGDSAILEYLNGKLVIHHGRQYQVMTNSPTYDQQLTLNSYWSRQDGSKFLPGSHASEDRFVRASYYLSKLPDTDQARQQVAGVFSVMRNISVPWGTIDPNHPNLAPTYWRTVLDHTRKVYYFESALSPSVVAVDLKQIDFAPGSGVRSVALEGEAGWKLQGNINKEFQPAKPISYLAPSK
ncbi:MAG: linear amide C-N hydrolase [Planctomycetes bacterium]|nr:linear amide C-N hydrolase [Planctomycetota bacterium]